MKAIDNHFKNFFFILVGKKKLKESVNNLKDFVLCLGMLCSKQCRVHTSQQIYKSLQSYSCHTRMWGEENTLKRLSQIYKSFSLSWKSFLLSATCFLPYNWDENKIPDEKLERCIEEYDSVETLCQCTVYCDTCQKRIIIDKQVENVDYCMCSGKLGYVNQSHLYDSWEPFLERENIIVWRKKQHANLYAYKVYAVHNDISLSAFLEVQLNSSYRTQWDSSALELKVVSSHPQSNSELLYWLVKFPHFFSNRDYIFKRRLRVNDENKEVVVMNEIVDLPQLPEEKGIHRVKEYWSTMVIKAKESFHKPGMSYTLTYFDNPGTSLPTTVTNFVASTAFPDFLQKVHAAAIKLQHKWQNGEDIYVSLPPSLRYKTKHDEAESLTELKKEMVTDVEVYEKGIVRSGIENSQRENVKKPKIPLMFSKAVVDLLEAIEVVAPEYEEKTALTSKVEKLVDNLNIHSSKRQELVKKLDFLVKKTKSFMSEAAKKKEESLKVMSEIERKYYYDQSASDEPSLLFFQSLLEAVTEILKADRDMRTGKELSKSRSKYSEPKETSVKFEKNNMERSRMERTENIQDCCCLKLAPSPSEDYWSYLLFSFNWWWIGNKSLKNVFNDPTCVCEHKINTNEKEHSSSNKSSLENKEESRVRYSFFSNLSICSESSCDNSESNKFITDRAQNENAKNKNGDNCEESMNFFIVDWLLNFLSKLLV